MYGVCCQGEPICQIEVDIHNVTFLGESLLYRTVQDLSWGGTTLLSKGPMLLFPLRQKFH